MHTGTVIHYKCDICLVTLVFYLHWFPYNLLAAYARLLPRPKRLFRVKCWIRVYYDCNNKLTINTVISHANTYIRVKFPMPDVRVYENRLLHCTQWVDNIE